MNTNPVLRSMTMALLGLVMMVGFTACQEEVPVATEQDAVETLAEDLSVEYGGLFVELEDADSIPPGTSCNASGTQTFTGANPAGTIVLWSYNYTRNFSYTCTNGFISTYSADLSGSRSYDAPRSVGTFNLSQSWTATNLGTSSPTVTVNGQRERTGQRTSRVGRQRSINTQLSQNFNDILVNKVTGLPSGGTIDFTFAAQGSGGASSSYSGTVTINADGTFTVVISGGGTFRVNTTTGTVL